MNTPPWNRRQPIFSASQLELAKSCLPLFGGAEDDDKKTSESSSKGDTGGGQATASKSGDGQSGNDTSTSAGGDSGPEMTPEQMADLLKQVETVTKANQDLDKKIKGFEAKETEAKRASMGREEALEADLGVAQETIAKMDAALRQQALVNAINSFKDIQWHDNAFPLSKLDPSIRENMTVDLDSSSVTVNGVENDLRRIAKEYDWAVVKGAAPAGTAAGGGRAPAVRGSGAPPAPVGGTNNKATRRTELEGKFSAIRRQNPVRPG